jgi:DNA-binding Lrp family transcriptional regulator
VGAVLLTKAYVLLTTDIGCEREICKIVKSIPEVRNAYTLHGVYDLIIDIETDDVDYLKEVIQNKIRSMKKVRSTITMIERGNEYVAGT